MSENEWVKFPDDWNRNAKLPKGSLIKSPSGTVFEMMSPSVVTEGEQRSLLVQLPEGYRFAAGQAVRDEPADLGDTPERLKPLLRAARAIDPGAIVYDDDTKTPGVIPSQGTWFYSAISGEGIRRNFDVFTPRAGIDRADIRRYIEKGRCYPTADARRIGREEFGMRFEDEPKLKYDIKCTANAQEIAEALQEAIDKHIAHVAGGPGPGVIKSGSVVYKGRTVGPASTHRPCACGSTTNVNLRLGVCAACHLEKRKAEVRAAMDRPVPKKCEESKAPRSWPADAGEDYEL